VKKFHANSKTPALFASPHPLPLWREESFTLLEKLNSEFSKKKVVEEIFSNNVLIQHTI
jgi:hypothetical protein